MTAVLTEDEQLEAIYDQFMGYQTDPIGFYVDVLGIPEKHIWSGPRRVAESVAANQLTAVPAGHSVSKTWGGGRLVNWFKTCFQPSTVVTTAPSDNQVRGQLWREIHAAFEGAKVSLGGKMTTLQWDMKPEPDVLASLPSECRADWEKNFAIGFSTSPDTVSDNATKMAGWHNVWMLIVIDEAGGIHPIISRTIMEGLVTNPRVKVLAIGNATDPNSEFAKWCEPDSEWNVVRISSEDTPNYKERREVIPGLAGYDWVERLRKKYGTDGNGFMMRCLGKFPTFMEGTFYGIQMAAIRLNERLGYFPHIETAMVYTAMDLGTVHNAVLFFQLIQSRIRIIDAFYDNTGMGTAGINKVLNVKPYAYNSSSHWVGSDILGSNRKNPTTGLLVINEAAALGLHLNVVVDESFDNGIREVRSHFARIDIHEPLTKDFVLACDNYKLKKDERLSMDDKPVYFDHPEKKWFRHMMDALRHLVLAYKFGIEVEGELIGYTGANPAVERSSEIVDMLAL